MSVEQSLLGKDTNYPTEYQPDILFPISRAAAREKYADVEGIQLGQDWWHVFEISWLNAAGVPQVAIGRITLPASSPNLIESKSLKLYFNSLNFTEFDNQQAVKAAVEKDLSACLKTDVTLEIFEVNIANSLAISAPQGDCIDNALDIIGKKIAIVSDVNPSSLTVANQVASDSQLQILHSHLLRSNCPVTNQPDWGTLEIQIDSQAIDRAGLLEYILSFRQHNGFHEQCVEQIFSDLTQAFAPKTLIVRAWYTRRGGIDINPCRVSDISLLPPPSRLNRQ